MRGPGCAHSRSDVVVVGQVMPGFFFFFVFYLLSVDLEIPETVILSWVF